MPGKVSGHRLAGSAGSGRECRQLRTVLEWCVACTWHVAWDDQLAGYHFGSGYPMRRWRVEAQARRPSSAHAAGLLAAKVPEAVGLPGLTRCAPAERAGTAPGPGIGMLYGYRASGLVLRGIRAGWHGPDGVAGNGIREKGRQVMARASPGRYWSGPTVPAAAAAVRWAAAEADSAACGSMCSADRYRPEAGAVRAAGRKLRDDLRARPNRPETGVHAALGPHLPPDCLLESRRGPARPPPAGPRRGRPMSSGQSPTW